MGASSELPRWLLHRRDDDIKKSSLRSQPNVSHDYCMKGCSALDGEVVEVLEPREVVDGFVNVRLAVGGQEGWLRGDYLHACPEGTRDHGRTASTDSLKQTPLATSDSRFKEIEQLIQCSWCVPGGCSRPCGKGGCPPEPSHRCIKAYADKPNPWEVEEITFLEGQFLGETGMVTGKKEVLFHGCKDSTVHLILENGFDLEYNSVGAFGRGCYFTPQACKAFNYSYDRETKECGRHLLVCEVALGAEDKRKILTAPDTSLDYQKVFVKEGYRSAAHHVDGGYYSHEERIIYRNTQCKPVYLVKMKTTSSACGL